MSVPSAARTVEWSSAQLERSLLCDELVEREREMDILSSALSALPGEGGVVVLAGEAGVGKTRLAREVASLARSRGLPVLSGRSVPGATPVPYRALTEAFLGAFRDAPSNEGPELAGFGGQVARLVPAWRRSESGGADESPVLLGEAVVRLLRVVGKGAGCVLLLEDLHWADVETIAVVEYLADVLRQEPTLCICTARPEGAAVDVLARLRRLPHVTVVGLSRLGRRGIERAVASCLGVDDAPADLVESIASNSEGNPFLIEELLAGLVASGALRFEDGSWTTAGRLAPSIPFDFAESMRQRLAVFDDAARLVLRAAALLGRRFDWELLPALAEVDARAVVDALRLAVDEQIVEADGEVFRFRHALTREAMLGELLPVERRTLAVRALPAVVGARPGLPGPWCELAADLAEEAGDHDAAAAHLVESARRALANGALTSAEGTATRARALASNGDLLDDADEVLAQILAMAGKPEKAAAVANPLVERLSARGELGRMARVLVVLARAAVAAGDLTRAQSAIDRAQLVVDETDDQLAASMTAVAAHIALDQDRVEDADRLAHAAVDLAQATGQPAVECEAYEVLGRVHRYSGDPDADMAWFARAGSLAEAHGLTAWQVRARHELALMSAYVKDDIRPLHETRDFAARTGALVSVAVMDLTLAEMALGGFERELCLESAQRCVDASRRYGLATYSVANLWLAGGHALADDLAAMEAASAAALELDPDDPRILGDLWGRVRATSAMVRDDVEELGHALDTMMTYVRVAPITTSIFPNRIFWGLLHTIHDDDRGAAARAELRAATNLRSFPVFADAMEIMEAVVRGRDGRAAEASALYAAASDRFNYRLDEGSIRYFHVLAAEAAIRDAWGDPVTQLRAAEAFFAARGYSNIVRRCRSLLARAGAPVSRRGRGDSVVPESLRALGITSRELDVLNLVAEGFSNREIAERLHLSPRTVERHLSSLFDRTGRRTREGLRELLHELLG